MKQIFCAALFILGANAMAAQVRTDPTPHPTPPPQQIYCSTYCEPWVENPPNVCAAPYLTQVRNCTTECNGRRFESQERNCVPKADYGMISLDGPWGSDPYVTETEPIKYDAPCDKKWRVNIRTTAHYMASPYTESDVWVECR